MRNLKLLTLLGLCLLVAPYAHAQRFGVEVEWVRATWGHLRCARMATTTITLTPAHPTATMDQAGSRAESLLAPGRGSMAFMAVRASTRDVATTDACRPFPGTRNFGVGSIVVTSAATLTVEAYMATRVEAVVARGSHGGGGFHGGGRR